MPRANRSNMAYVVERPSAMDTITPLRLPDRDPLYGPYLQGRGDGTARANHADNVLLQESVFLTVQASLMVDRHTCADANLKIVLLQAWLC